ncbi:guanylyl cyclase [Hypericibacter terrae]|jgi:adenylate cyclase|uniref:Guanylyl cyclase n=1 Tax=Hypericibacter terrae TaxID=2602015 RepID=A0A5J6MMI1_9PROT|nr:adenylate/guanylate cyclase domain-containing protein [Hypericibacter terrae]QEX18583.1 guanylyl cyclase [Hypericibacter terrae]
MPEERIQRRLAAILAADVVGYSRMMSEDESGTLAMLKQRRQEVLAPLVSQHGGRIFKLMGDGVLVEFPSVVDAVQCAVDVQKGMAAQNAALPANKQVLLRVGVNLGDVIVEGSDLYGDGVNLASRIEGLAQPGGICLSDTAHHHVASKLSLDYHDMGEQSLKNIAKPVRVYSVGPGAVSAGSDEQPQQRDKPAIVVLPFTNMSGDPEQEFFADGLTEDILTELSRFRELLVISRNTSSRYKGKAVEVKKIAKELGVDYLLEGSVRKVGNRVRITVQLIDAVADRHIWADRYDRDLADIFAMQDEVTSSVVATLPRRVESATRERAANKPTENMAAYECVLTGKLLHHRSNKADNAAALEMLERATKLDPKYAHAHAWLACTLGQSWVNGFCADRDATWNRMLEELQTAYALDSDDSDVHRILAAVSLARDDFDKATYHQERALTLNPNDDLVVVQQGEVLTWLGRPEEGIDWIKKAMRLNPYHPERFWNHLGRAYFVAHRYAEAVDAFKRITALDHTHHAFLAAAHAQMGNQAEMRSHAGDVLSLKPDFTVESYLPTVHYKRPEDRDHHRASLLKAGLPA